MHRHTVCRMNGEGATHQKSFTVWFTGLWKDQWAFLCFRHQFFNQVLMLGKTSVSDLSEHVFDLILELYNIDSHLLLSVLPQLEFKLKVLKPHLFDLTLWHILIDLIRIFATWVTLLLSLCLDGILIAVKEMEGAAALMLMLVLWVYPHQTKNLNSLTHYPQNCTFSFSAGLLIHIRKIKPASQHNVASAVSHKGALLMDNAH